MAQNYTDNCFDPNNVAQTDLQNIENNFAAVKSQFSGAGAPANPVPGMPWIDLTRHMLCVRNEANNAWIDMLNLATGQPATLPTAAAGTKGGIKIGARLTMTGEVLSADSQVSYPLAVNLGGTAAETASAAADNLSVVKRDHGHDVVGSLCFASYFVAGGYSDGTVTVTAGSTYAGSLLKASSYGGGRAAAALTGTWRALGHGISNWQQDPTVNADVVTLFQRIA